VSLGLRQIGKVYDFSVEKLFFAAMRLRQNHRKCAKSHDSNFARYTIQTQEHILSHIKLFALVSIFCLTNITRANESNSWEYSIGIGERYGHVGVNVEYLLTEKIGVFAGLGVLKSHKWLIGSDYYIQINSSEIKYRLTAAYGEILTTSCSNCASDKFNRKFYSPVLGASILYKKWEYGLYWEDHNEFNKFVTDARKERVIYGKKSPLEFSVGYHF
jgi:hypothetical protein